MIALVKTYKMISTVSETAFVCITKIVQLMNNEVKEFLPFGDIQFLPFGDIHS